MGIALVTGASRGVGRGVASTLAKRGFKVYGTGRRIEEAHLPDAVVRIPCDHLSDGQTSDMFRRVETESGQLDVLVNCAWGGYEKMIERGTFTWALPFWEQPLHRWTSMIDAGVRSAYTCAALAARIMVERRSGLIVNISYWAAQKHIGNVIYGLAKAATDKMTADMAVELQPHGVTVISLYPGLVRTEAVIEAAKAGWLDLSNSESPEFIGSVIAALASDPALLQRSGSVLVAASVAGEFGISDDDGRQPRPLTRETA